MPGQKLKLEPSGHNFARGFNWEVKTNVYNEFYFYCTETGSKAWFVSEDSQFYFTGFEGNKKSLLYYFFLGAYHVYKGFYRDISVRDSYPLHLIYKPSKLILQDFMAPFFIFKNADFYLKYTYLDNPVMPSLIKLESLTRTYTGKKKKGREIKFSLEINEKGISGFVISEQQKIMKVKCTG